jgi:hypothetical protein
MEASSAAPENARMNMSRSVGDIAYSPGALAGDGTRKVQIRPWSPLDPALVG